MKKIYEELYNSTAYGKTAATSPGCLLLNQYAKWLKFPAIDVGCGAGVLVRQLRGRGKEVDGVDFVNNGFCSVGDITTELDFSSYETAICTDVFEHIAIGGISQLITNMAACTNQVISINNGPSVTKYNGKDLHVNIKPWDEWEMVISQQLVIEETIVISDNERIYLCTKQGIEKLEEEVVSEDWKKLEEEMTVEIVEEEILAEDEPQNLQEVFEERVEEKLAGEEPEGIFIIDEMTDEELGLAVKQCEENIIVLNSLTTDMSVEIKVVEDQMANLNSEILDRKLSAIDVVDVTKAKEDILRVLEKKFDIPSNKKLIIEDGQYYIITVTSTGKERKGSRKIFNND